MEGERLREPHSLERALLRRLTGTFALHARRIRRAIPQKITMDGDPFRMAVFDRAQQVFAFADHLVSLAFSIVSRLALMVSAVAT